MGKCDSFGLTIPPVGRKNTRTCRCWSLFGATVAIRALQKNDEMLKIFNQKPLENTSVHIKRNPERPVRVRAPGPGTPERDRAAARRADMCSFIVYSCRQSWDSQKETIRRPTSFTVKMPRVMFLSASSTFHRLLGYCFSADDPEDAGYLRPRLSQFRYTQTYNFLYDEHQLRPRSSTPHYRWLL